MLLKVALVLLIAWFVAILTVRQQPLIHGLLLIGLMLLLLAIARGFEPRGPQDKDALE